MGSRGSHERREIFGKIARLAAHTSREGLGWLGRRERKSHGTSGLRFLSVEGLPALFQFPPDMAPMAMPANRLNDQVLVRAYDQDWKDVSH